MSVVEHEFNTDDIHPIDIVETLAEYHDWDFDRVADDQIAMAIEANWRVYSLTLAWSNYDETLRLVCAFEMAPPKDRLADLYYAMERANDRCWSGAFTLWKEQKLMAFRHGMNLSGGATVTGEQISEMVRAALGACEQFFPAFQLVCWGETPVEKAMEIAMTEAYGRA